MTFGNGLFLVALFIFGATIAAATGAPIDDLSNADDSPIENLIQSEDSNPPMANSNATNQVQEFFEDLSKNVTSGGEKALQDLQKWFSKLPGLQGGQNSNSNSNNPNGVLPTMYLGSFQLLKMPMPQIGDMFQGLSSLASAANGLNGLMGSGINPLKPKS